MAANENGLKARAKAWTGGNGGKQACSGPLSHTTSIRHYAQNLILSTPGRPAVVTDAFSAALGLGILLIDLHP